MRGLKGRLNRATHEVEVVEVVDTLGCRTFSIAGRADIGGSGIVGRARCCWEKEGGQGLVVLGDEWLSGVRSQRGRFLVVMIYNVVGDRVSSGLLQSNNTPTKAAS
jgi:hypothetical protein